MSVFSCEENTLFSSCFQKTKYELPSIRIQTKMGRLGVSGVVGISRMVTSIRFFLYKSLFFRNEGI